MMLEIIPAILPKNYEDLRKKVSEVRGLVPLVQVDICDGIFTNSLTWPFLSRSSGHISESEVDNHFQRIMDEEEGMPHWEDMDYELDLMTSDAVKNFDIYTRLGPKRVIFHLAAVGDKEEFKEFLEGMDPYLRENIEIGVATTPSAPIEDIFSLGSLIDFVQVMGNDKVGYQGMELDPKVYEKTSAIRDKYPEMPIAVDIGVNLNTAEKLVDAGVSKLVAGSAIYNSGDIIGAIERLRSLA